MKLEMNEQNKRNLYNILLYATAFPAIIWSISITTYYVKAAIEVGHLPSYNNPDPKIFSYHTFFSDIIESALVLWVLIFLIWLLVIGIHVYNEKRNLNKKSIIISGVFQLIGFSVLFSEMFEWFVD